MYVFALSRALTPTRKINLDPGAVFLNLHCVPILVIMIGAVLPLLVVGGPLDVKVVILDSWTKVRRLIYAGSQHIPNSPRALSKLN